MLREQSPQTSEVLEGEQRAQPTSAFCAGHLIDTSLPQNRQHVLVVGRMKTMGEREQPSFSLRCSIG